ncbi:Serine protease Do-like HtrB [uncultured bacterium]|nr:Serine protease Do-like HtrB [uncultured bacterium]
MKVPNTVLTSLYLLAFFLFASPVFAQQQSPAPSVQEPPSQKESSRPWLGVTIQEVNERIASQMGITDPRGVLVADVADGSPADEAGVNLGDVIVRLNGRDVEDAGDFINRIQEAGVGSTVALEVNRAGATEEINVTLEPMPPAAMLGSARMGGMSSMSGMMSGMGQGMGQGMGMMTGGGECPMHSQGMGHDCPMGQSCPNCPSQPMMGGAECPGHGPMGMGPMGKMHRHPGKGMMMGMGGQMDMMGGPVYGKIMMAVKNMNLTPEQKAKFDVIHSDFKKRAVRAAADVKVAHIEVHELMAADPVNLDRVRAKVNELFQKKSEMMMLGIRSLEDFKKLLNPGQKKMLKDMLAMDSADGDMEEAEALDEGAE